MMHTSGPMVAMGHAGAVPTFMPYMPMQCSWSPYAPQLPDPQPQQAPTLRPPSEYEFEPITIERDSLCQDTGIVVDGTLVTEVMPGSLGSVKGVMKGMKITTVNGKDATADSVAHVLENSVLFTFTVACSCLQRLRGEVDSWDAQKSGGWIMPTLPVFVGSGTWGAPTVYFGNIRCNSSALPSGVTSLAPRQKVEFTVRVSGSRLLAESISGPRGGQLQEFNATLRPVITRGLSLGAAREVCAQFAKGVCPYASEACPNGVHPQPAEAPKKKKLKKSKKHITKTVFNDGWDVITLSAEGICKDLMYSKNSGTPRHVTKVEFSTVTRRLLLTCQGECEEVVEQPLPEEGIATILSDVISLCKESNVCCSVPPSVTSSSQNIRQLLTEVCEKKLVLLREAYEGACEDEEAWGILKAWEVHADAHQLTFSSAEEWLMKKNKKAPTVVDTYCGLPESCVLEDALNGLQRTTLQYTNPNRASENCCGGSFMFRCKTILGDGNGDFITVPEGYEVAEGRAVPCFLLQFGYTESKLAEDLKMFSKEVQEEYVPLTKLGESQRGGTGACRGRTDSAMMAETTSRIWLGWLEPEFEQSDDDIAADVVAHLVGHTVVFVKIERNAARIGAFVELQDPVTQCQLAEINTRLYKGLHTISVDDSQPGNPWTSRRPCPRMQGPAKYCRGWNIKGHKDWTESCSFNHRAADNILQRPAVRYRTAVQAGTQLYGELAIEIEGRQLGHVVHIEQVSNSTLEEIYETRKRFLSKKHHDGIVERDLWYGASPYMLSQVLDNGLQPPSDTLASRDCPVSGNRGLQTTACGSDCRYCIEPHTFTGCHKYGLGIRLTETPTGAHRDVVPDQRTGVHSLMKCKVNLGSPYLIDKKLVEQAALHGVVRPVDPEGRVEKCSSEWRTATGHDAYHVNNGDTEEYVVFHPFQILPQYIIHYKLGAPPQQGTWSYVPYSTF